MNKKLTKPIGGELSTLEIQIPSNTDAMVAAANQINDLVFAGRWGTAALVYAWTYDTGGGRPKSDEKSSLYTMSDFATLGIRGLSSRDAVRAYRKAWQRAIDEGIADPVEPGDSITLPEIDFGATKKNNHLAQGTGQNEWYTPPDVVETVNSVLGEIDLDPASNDEANETIGAKEYFTESDSGLEKEWHGRVWLNPPYSRELMPAFVNKLIEEYQSGRVTEAILVAHNNTDTRWFQSLAAAASAVCFPSQRIKFYRGEDVAAPVNGQCFFYLGKDKKRFVKEFKEFGVVMFP